MTRLGLKFSIALAAWVFAFSVITDHANAESYGDKTCSLLPKTCQWNYSGGSLHSYYLNTSGCSNCTGAWSSEYSSAYNSWTAVYGPQIFTVTMPSGNYTTVFLKEWPTYTLPISSLAGANMGVTANVNYDTGNWCNLTTNPCRVHWSEIYLDTSDLNSASQWERRWLIAHEFGHAQGLRHNGSGSPNSLMHTAVHNSNTPTSADTGSSNSCSSNETIGCIYNW